MAPNVVSSMEPSAEIRVLDKAFPTLLAKSTILLLAWTCDCASTLLIDRSSTFEVLLSNLLSSWGVASRENDSLMLNLTKSWSTTTGVSLVSQLARYRCALYQLGNTTRMPAHRDTKSGNTSKISSRRHRKFSSFDHPSYSMPGANESRRLAYTHSS